MSDNLGATNEAKIKWLEDRRNNWNPNDDACGTCVFWNPEITQPLTPHHRECYEHYRKVCEQEFERKTFITEVSKPIIALAVTPNYFICANFQRQQKPLPNGLSHGEKYKIPEGNAEAVALLDSARKRYPK